MAVTFPANPVNGQTYSANGQQYTYNAEAGLWDIAATPATSTTAGGITMSDSAPSNPAVGDQWFNTELLETYVWYSDVHGSYWVKSNPTGATENVDVPTDINDLTDTSGLLGSAALTDISVTTAAASATPSLTYDNTTGTFTYTPPDLSSASSGSITTTYTEIQIETTTPNTDSLNELWFNPDTATWSKTIQNPVTSSVLNTQVASNTTTGIFPSTSTGTISWPYGLISGTVTFTTPLWLVSYSGPSFDRVEIASYVLEDDTVISTGGVYNYSNSGTEWANQRVKSITFTSGYRANGTTATLTAAGAPIWDELDQTLSKTVTLQGVKEKTTTITPNVNPHTLDCSASHIFVMNPHQNPNANVTVDLINLSMNANESTAISILADVGPTAWHVGSLRIDGVAQTINWQGGSLYTPTASGYDLITFSIFYDGTTYTVLGQSGTYG